METINNDTKFCVACRTEVSLDKWAKRSSNRCLDCLKSHKYCEDLTDLRDDEIKFCKVCEKHLPLVSMVRNEKRCLACLAYSEKVRSNPAKYPAKIKPVKELKLWRR